MARSLARSTSVTQSPGAPLASPLVGGRPARTTSLPTCAAPLAVSRIASGSMGRRRYQRVVGSARTSDRGRHARRSRRRWLTPCGRGR
jgi:hypothetical protein